MTIPRKEPLPYAKGERMQMHPATDTWMRGDRYGTVVHVGRRLVHVHLDKSGHVARVHPSNLVEMPQ